MIAGRNHLKFLYNIMYFNYMYYAFDVTHTINRGK